MKRPNILLLIALLCLFLPMAGYGQDASGLYKLMQSARDPYIKPESLDQLVIQLRPYTPGANNVSLDSVYLAYRLVANGYALNNHFRQAYECYRRYLVMKEPALGEARHDSILSRQQAISRRIKQEEDQIMEGNNVAQDLQIEIDQQTSRHAFMRQFFSIMLVALSAIIALMLVRSGIQLNSYRNKLKESQQNLRDMHRKALVGRLSRGIFGSRLERRSEIIVACEKLIDTLTNTSANASQDKDRKRWLDFAKQIQAAFYK